jgi:hypothetical protein
MSPDQFDDIVVLPDDGSRQQEVYARFGLAVYWAQVFEVGLANLIVVLVSHRARTGRPLSRNQVDELYESLFAKTAGRLVGELRRALGDDPHIDICEEAVKERNRLMHHFFRIHDRDFLTLAGKQRMVETPTGSATSSGERTRRQLCWSMTC